MKKMLLMLFIAIVAMACQTTPDSYLVVELNESGRRVKVEDIEKLYTNGVSDKTQILVMSVDNSNDWYICNKDYKADTTVTLNSKGAKLEKPRLYRLGTIVSQYTLD